MSFYIWKLPQVPIQKSIYKIKNRSKLIRVEVNIKEKSYIITGVKQNDYLWSPRSKLFSF